MTQVTTHEAGVDSAEAAEGEASQSGDATGGRANRRYPRYVVNLAVRFSSAQNYVEQYADNLSQGGLFVAGAQHHLEPMQEVDVEVELPGYGTYSVGTRVAYVLDQQGAAREQRPPGAGLAVVSAPADFQKHLMEYLLLLGRRKDVFVLVAPADAAEFLSAAGFRVANAPPPARVSLAVMDTPRVVGVVVSRTDAAAYMAALQADDLPTDLVLVAEAGSSQLDLLNAIDRRVVSATA